jgi:hypothetical protein
MPQEILIEDIVDVSGTQRDLNQLYTSILKIDQAIQEVNQRKLKFDNVSGLRELRDATDQLIKATKTLTDTINDTARAAAMHQTKI